MNKDEFDQGYRTGAASTQDQARGAREAERERERAAREQQAHWDSINRQQDEQRRRQEQQMAERHQRSAEQARNQRTARSSSPRVSTTAAGGNAARSIIGLVGLISGAVLGYKWLGEQWLGVAIVAIVAGLMAVALYKVIIGVAVIGGLLWLWINNGSESGATRVPELVTPSSVVARELWVENRCPYSISLAVEWQGGEQRYIDGFWDIAANARNVRLNSGNAPVQMTSPAALLFARGVSEPITWGGSVVRQLRGEQLGMREAGIDERQAGHYLMSLNCDAYKPAPVQAQAPAIQPPDPLPAIGASLPTPAEMPPPQPRAAVPATAPTPIPVTGPPDGSIDLPNNACWSSSQSVRASCIDVAPYVFGTPRHAFLVRRFGGPVNWAGFAFDASAIAYTKELSFYPGYTFAYVLDPAMPVGVRFLIHEASGNVIHLDGTNRPIYELNKRLSLRLGVRDVSDYAAFFNSVVAGRHGRFIPVYTAEQIAWSSRLNGPALEQNKLTATRVIRRAELENMEGLYRIRLNVMFQDSLFRTDVYVQPDGTMAFADEIELISAMPVHQDGVRSQLER